jgi:hypothetical protein
MSDYQKIIDVVEKEAIAVEDLLISMKKKQKSIIAMSVDNLQVSISEEIKLLSITRSLEKERIELIESIIPGAKSPAKITISDMIKVIPEEESKKLSLLKVRLKKSLEEVKHVNELNRILLERSKKFIKDNISIITCQGEKKLVNKKV